MDIRGGEYVLFGDEDYKYFKNSYCIIKWILIFIMFFMIEDEFLELINQSIFEKWTATLVSISVWNGCVYYIYKKIENDKKNTYRLSIVELVGDVISIIYLAQAQVRFGDGFLYLLLVCLIGITFVRYGLSTITYISVAGILSTIFYIDYNIYTNSYYFEEQKILIALVVGMGSVVCMYFVGKENKHLKTLIGSREKGIQELEQQVEEREYLSTVIANIYKTNDIDTIIELFLENIYKFTNTDGIGFILYGENDVESDARRYTYRDVKEENYGTTDKILYQPFYAQKQLQIIREHKAYKNCILSYEPINKVASTQKVIQDILPETNEQYIYLFNMLQGDEECGMLVCNIHQRLPVHVCKKIDELIKYVAVALLKVKVLEQEKTKVMYDTLTGVKSRRYLDEILPIIAEKSRRKQIPIGVLFFDLDRFKSFNDTYGHHVGDIILKEMAMIIEQHIPEESLVARYGGEEFVGIIENGSVEKSYEIAENIRESIAHLSLSNYTKDDIHITISIGVAIYEKGEQSIVETIQCADQAMYEAKKTKNKVCVYGG